MKGLARSFIYTAGLCLSGALLFIFSQPLYDAWASPPAGQSPGKGRSFPDFFLEAPSAAGNQHPSIIAGSGQPALLPDEPGRDLTIPSQLTPLPSPSLTFQQTAKLVADDGAAEDKFGTAVAISGDTAIVGASYDDDKGLNSGAAYIFGRTGTTWSQQAKLTAADGAAWDKFGTDVALSDDTAIVGAPWDDDKDLNSGAAYIFGRTGTTWSQQAKLTVSDGARDGEFGQQVALSGDTAAIGGGDEIYIFGRTGTEWEQQAKLTAADGVDYFGSVALSGDVIIGGDSYDDAKGANAGAAYIFEKQGQAPLTLDLLGPDGAAVTGPLRLNEEGWPTPNPLTATVTMRCPADGEDCSEPVWLTIESPHGSAARFYLIESADHQAECQETLYYSDTTDYSHIAYEAECALDIPAGAARTLTWSVWVQPSPAATLDFKVEWDDETPGQLTVHTARQTLQIPAAQIHPVIFLHGILGAMPPRNTIISTWPQKFDVPADETWLDPFVAIYSPLIDNLLKMGYQLDQTLFPVTYDWRQSNRISACWLRDVLHKHVPDSGAIIAADGKADVIVHSMGGLVLRAYLQDMGHETWEGDEKWGALCPYNDDVRKAIFIASPHRGFPVTYNTREGLTWRDYMKREVKGRSGGPVLRIGMDYFIWPLLIRKQFNPAPHEPCGNLLLESLSCPEEALYHFSHSRAARGGHFRGVESLAEMLPDEDIPHPYLLTEDKKYPYPDPPGPSLGRELNPLLDGSTGLNSAAGLTTLLSRVPPDNLYTIYIDDQSTVRSYVVDAPPPPTEPYCFGVLVPFKQICLGWQIPAVAMWPNGFPQNTNKEDDGDNLIPAYSTNLNDSTEPLIPDLPSEGSLAVNDSVNDSPVGHKLIVSSPKTQSAVAAILTGFAEPSVAVAAQPFPIQSPYAAPLVVDANSLGTLLGFMTLSPVDVLITAPDGRRIGYDPVANQVRREIPGAFYSGVETDMEFFLLPAGQTGVYTITAAGVGTGPYAVLAYHLGATEATFLGGLSGAAVPGRTTQATVVYEPVVEQLLFEDTEAGGPWTVAGGWGVAPAEGQANPPAWASDAAAPPVPGRASTLALTTPLDVTVARQARLTFNSRSNLAPEAQAVIELSTDGGASWQVAGRQPAGDSSWRRRVFDLTPFTFPGSPTLRLRFRLLPAAATDRWLLDDIRVEGVQAPSTFGLPFEDDLEGRRRWDPTGGWTWTEAVTHSPDHAWRSQTAGGTLTLAGTAALTGVTHPRLIFWHTPAADTQGRVEVSPDGGQNWTGVYTTARTTDQWARVVVDLRPYAGRQVSLRFRHTGGGAWAVDDISLRNAPPLKINALPFQDDMDPAQNNWQGLNGWTVDTTEGRSDQISWRSETPESSLKLVDRLDLKQHSAAVLTFWQRFDLPAGSLGTVEISTDGGLTWTPVHTQTAPVPVWRETTVDLSSYAGQEIGLVFYLQQAGSGPGWFVDDVAVTAAGKSGTKIYLPVIVK